MQLKSMNYYFSANRHLFNKDIIKMTGNTDPLVSVVIPSYNHACYLGRALSSVLKQTYPSLEVIVVDNYSTDHTDEVMKSFNDSRITYFKIRNNGIIAASRNAGIRAAKGEWIAFLDSDDWWTEDKLSISFSKISKRADFLYHDLAVVYEKKAKLFGAKFIKSRRLKVPIIFDLLIYGNTIANSSVVVRKSLLEKIGGISESEIMVAAEDYNSWLEISKLTNNFIYIPRILGYYQKHNKNASNKDMSLAERHATVKFLSILNSRQVFKIEARIRYIKGRFNISKNNFSEARSDFLFCIRNGVFNLRIKSFLFIVVLYSYEFFGWKYKKF
jgi:glycosyltransferase involved in cell wall biosynthesis